MSGIGNTKNKLIVVEILRSAETHADGTESNIFFNGRIKEVKDVTERQRLKFHEKKGHFSSTTNIDLAHLLTELHNTLTDSTYIHIINTKGKERKKK